MTVSKIEIQEYLEKEKQKIIEQKCEKVNNSELFTLGRNNGLDFGIEILDEIIEKLS